MDERDPSVSVPHATLTGSWEVLRRTGDGRASVAVRSDERSGVAIAYPYAESGASALKIAAVRNTVQDYVLCTGSFQSVEAIGNCLGTDSPRRRIDLERFERLGDAATSRVLAGGTVLVVDVGEDRWYPGALQLFESVEAVRDRWLRSFPNLGDRLVAVERVTKGVDLRAVAATNG